MNIKLILISSLTIFLCNTAPCFAAGTPQLGKDSIDDVIANMTLEEKINTVIGVGFIAPGLSLDSDLRGPDIARQPQKVPGAAGDTFPIERLGIPSIVLADGPAGLRIQPQRDNDSGQTYYATAFPIATLLASSWDPQLVEEVGRAMGNEVREYGADILLAPALNIHRYPLGGRNFEYYSEDPLIAGKMAAAMVRGVQSQGVGTSLKHLVANNHEWNRTVLDVQVEQRALREIYLRGFEIAVKEGHPWTIMTSYNKLNGVYTSERSDLLTDIVKGQWGFEGFIMSDWFAGRDAVAQMQAGNDMLMPGTLVQQRAIRNAVQSGELDEAVLDRNIRNILNIVLQSQTFANYQYSDHPQLTAHAQIARRAAAEGMVLLKNNNNTLPLAPGKTIALFGNTSYNIFTGGTGSGDVNEAYSVSMEQGFEDAGFMVNGTLQARYHDYLDRERANQSPVGPFQGLPPIAEMDIDPLVLKQVAQATDLAIFTLGRNAGEGSDRKNENDFSLSDSEQQLIDNISTVFRAENKPFIIILNIGGVIETASWRDNADAILAAWQGGQEAGHAIADVLSGNINPSGRLATTFPLKLEDYPQHDSFPGTVLKASSGNNGALFASDEAAEIQYTEGIWVGYRYFNTNNVDVAYPFGFGLSFSTFEFSDATVSSAVFNDSITVSVNIRNTGNMAGKEVVQLYVQAPDGKLIKPSSELRAFAKTRQLQSGDSQRVTMTLNARDLSSFDDETNQWLAEPGEYAILVGQSSRNIAETLHFTLDEAIATPP